MLPRNSEIAKRVEQQHYELRYILSCTFRKLRSARQCTVVVDQPRVAATIGKQLIEVR